MRLIKQAAAGLFIASTVLLPGCVTETEYLSPGASGIQEPSIIAVSTPGYALPKGAAVSWHPPSINVYKDERLDSGSIQYQIERVVRQELDAIGLRFVAEESMADYTIAYTAGLESSLDDTEVLRRFGLLPGNMQVPENSSNYEKGTLVIYMLDRRSREVVWRSAMQTAVDFSLDSDARRERIDSIVQAMFKTLPVKAP